MVEKLVESLPSLYCVTYGITEIVDVTSSIVPYGKDMHIVLAPMLHGAQLDGVHAGSVPES
jgi:hypothetical protein